MRLSNKDMKADALNRNLPKTLYASNTSKPIRQTFANVLPESVAENKAKRRLRAFRGRNGFIC